MALIAVIVISGLIAFISYQLDENDKEKTRVVENIYYGRNEIWGYIYYVSFLVCISTIVLGFF